GLEGAAHVTIGRTPSPAPGNAGTPVPVSTDESAVVHPRDASSSVRLSVEPPFQLPTEAPSSLHSTEPSSRPIGRFVEPAIATNDVAPWPPPQAHAAPPTLRLDRVDESDWLNAPLVDPTRPSVLVSPVIDDEVFAP